MIALGAVSTALNSLAWPVAVVVLSVVGAVTYLGSQHILASSDITTILVLILGAVGITTTAHVTASAVSNAANIQPPAGPPGKLV